MKTKQLFFLFTFVLAMTACGDDDPVNIHGNSKSKSISDDNGPNTNRNTIGPTEAQTRYEFPQLKGGNNITIVHKATLVNTSGDKGINYSVEWDPAINAQRWSCYQMYDVVSQSNVSRYSATNDGTLSSNSQYPNDPDLPKAYQFTFDPYKYNNIDHGHICPSADRLSSSEANYQTFFITNMQPQYPNFNGSNRDPSINKRSPWYRLEDKLRTWAKSCDTLYVCKGGTIDKIGNDERIITYLTDQSLRENKIPVPKYFFVALFAKKGTNYKAVGFWMEHVSSYDSQRPLSYYARTIDELEKLTDIDFFCNLPDNIEDVVEKSYSESDWAGNLQ